MACPIEYVVHGGLVYDADEWHNSHDANRYDDILSVTVDIDHSAYPDDEQKLYDDLSDYWSKGVKPSYVL